MKKLYEILMNVRCNYSRAMQRKGLDKWQVRETLIYKLMSTAIYHVYKAL